jgi:hypothetical protein
MILILSIEYFYCILKDVIKTHSPSIMVAAGIMDGISSSGMLKISSAKTTRSAV